MRKLLLIVCMVCAAVLNMAQTPTGWEKNFKDVPSLYRPQPFWHMNGRLTNEGIDSQMHDVKYKSNFGGVTVLPVSKQGSGNKAFPGTEPAYLTDEYFNYYSRILKDAKELDMHVVWYDDLDFPSGSAGGRMKKMYPLDVRKILTRTEVPVAENTAATINVSKGRLMAAVAMNTQTKERIDVSTSVKDGTLNWKAPGANWKVMAFICDTAGGTLSNDIAVDYLDPAAIDKYIELNNEQFAKRYKSYFGTTIKQIFFDDVGFYTGPRHGERTWTNKFNERFKELYGKNPALYYPAMWEDIGPETEAARVMLFNTRAVLLSEGFPKKVTEWCEKYGLKSSGHPPGNYEIQPVDMNADILKYYRYQHIPLMDLIFYYGHGREGYKLVSSSGNLYDKPVVAAEIYGAIGLFGKNKFDSLQLYRAAMEVFTRGINFLVPHGMWYNPDSAAIRIPPLISAYSPTIGPALHEYNSWAGRACYMLQGGKTVSDIAVLYPIASLEAWFHFQAKDNKDWGKYVPPGTDYLAVSNMLTNEVHRDFTFVHPEVLTNKCLVQGNELVLDNKVNRQQYKVLIMPGGKVISLSALQKIKAFYDNGGKVIATSVLPSKSAEAGQDAAVVALVKDMFGVDAGSAVATTDIKQNAKGGAAVFIAKPSADNLAEAMEKMGTTPDVVFENNPHTNSANGMLSYIHKIKDGKHIYFFANSLDDKINTHAELRGRIKPQLWNPYDGSISAISDVTYIKKNGQTYTRLPLQLNAIKSVFVIGR